MSIKTGMTTTCRNGGNTVRVDRAMSLSVSSFRLNPLQYLYENRKADNIGEVIDIGMLQKTPKG